MGREKEWGGDEHPSTLICVKSIVRFLPVRETERVEKSDIIFKYVQILQNYKKIQM